jgi:hypothetical protein
MIQTQRALQRKYGIRPKDDTINRYIDNFLTYGSVNKPREETESKICTEELIKSVEKIVVEATENGEVMSIRRIARELGISKYATHLTLKKELHFHPYHPIPIHHLNEDDPQARIEFAQQFIYMQNRDTEFVEKIIWSDESIFTINGVVNRHNSVYWSATNPNIILEQDKLGPKVMVWAGIWSGGRVGPYFTDESVTAESYLNLLHYKVWPSIKSNVTQRSLWFQQDGAPAHYGSIVRNWLDSHFPKRWIGRRSDFPWPPRSPDLTTADFFLWGYLKDKVYKRRPTDISTLKLYIIEEFNNIPQEMIKKSCRSVIDCLKHCLENNGQHFYLTYR